MITLITLLFATTHLTSACGNFGDCLDTELLRVENNVNSMMYKAGSFFMNMDYVYLNDIDSLLNITTPPKILKIPPQTFSCTSRSYNPVYINKLNRLTTLRNDTYAVNYSLRKMVPHYNHRLMTIYRTLRNKPKCIDADDLSCVDSEMSRMSTAGLTMMGQMDAFLANFSDALIIIETLLGYQPPQFFQGDSPTRLGDCDSTADDHDDVLSRIIRMKKAIYYNADGYTSYIPYMLSRINKIISTLRKHHIVKHNAGLGDVVIT